MAYRTDGDAAHTLAQGLGWFSIGLGVAELVAPDRLARFLGMEQRTDLIRFYGAREITTGVGILTQGDPTPWLWGRVGGDIVDLATLAVGLAQRSRRGSNVVLDVLCAQALSRRPRRRPRLRLPDYSSRRGLPRPPDEMRGAARDSEVPSDMRIPEAMRPYPA
jgi:hypothetical protein